VLSPEPLVAFTENAYPEPFVSPVTVQLSVGSVGVQLPAVDAVFLMIRYFTFVPVPEALP